MTKAVRISDLSVADLIIDLTDNPLDKDYRQMVIYELMKRTGESINGDDLSTFSARMKDQYEKKILAFPARKLSWPEYIS
jgi:hypothetical protein